ncbi:MAG: hypothetical protein ACXAC8_14320 [Candidatus Hodarchaeales archaeon]
MIGVNITTKSGLLLFSYFFIGGFSDVDEDLRAGLMTAVLNAVKETNDNTGIKTIDQGRYFVHIIEGKHTYGLFFSHENDLKEFKFANVTLTKFEDFFGEKLQDNIPFDDFEFHEFEEYLKKEYSSLISIDVVGLSKIIEVMDESFFSDYIILEKPYLHQVFTTINTAELHPHANQIAYMCKNIIESSIRINLEITRLKFNLGEEFFVFADQFKKYIVILAVHKEDHDKAVNEIVKIHSKIEMFFLQDSPSEDVF